MIIVRFQGGLGNQMFQYGLYKELKLYRNDVKADIIPYTSHRDKRSFELEEAFGIKLDVATPKEIFKLAGGECSWQERMIRKYLKSNNICREDEIGNIEDIIQKKDVYVDGYWQSEDWFRDVKEDLRRDFQFKNNMIIDEMCQVISEVDSVSIHVRMGDYLENESLYGGICTKKYYESAIQYIRKVVENPKFYIFSDEPEKAKEMLGELEGANYIIDSEKDYYDMQLMSWCKNNILANSSFSWWGAWLNNNLQKIVIAPNKWNNINRLENIFVNNWIRL